MAKNIFELKELINKHSGKSNFLASHFSTETMVKHSIGYIMEATDVRGKAISGSIQSAVEKFGDALLEKNDVESMMVVVCEKAVEAHVAVEETQGNLGVKKKLPMFLDVAASAVESDDGLKKTFADMTTDFSQDHAYAGFVDAIKKAGVEDNHIDALVRLTLLVALVRSTMNKANATDISKPKATDANGNLVDVDVIEPSAATHTVNIPADSSTDSLTATDDKNKKFELVVADLKKGGYADKAKFFNDVKILLKEIGNNPSNAVADNYASILKPYYTDELVEGLASVFSRTKYEELSEDGKFHQEVLDGMFPEGERPNFIKNITVTLANEMVKDGKTFDAFIEHYSEYAQTYALMTGVICVLLAPKSDNSHDVINFFRTIIDLTENKNNDPEHVLDAMTTGMKLEKPEDLKSFYERVIKGLKFAPAKYSIDGYAGSAAQFGIRANRSKCVFAAGIEAMKAVAA